MSLRERNKARTRQEIIDAAFALFAERGFDRVTVDEIAAAADVSPRTFFRYFPVKEDVATAEVQEAAGLLLRELAARPAGESPLVALQRAAHAPLARLSANPRACAVLRAMEGSTDLVAYDMSLRARTQESIAAVLAERMGVDLERDALPRLIAAAALAALAVAVHGWVEHDGGDDLDARLDEAFALLRGGLGELSGRG